MKTSNKSLLVIAVIAGSFLSIQLLNPSFSGIASAAFGDCGCGCATETAAPCESCVTETTCTKKRDCGCKRCKRPSRKINCPSCAVECDSCTLELDHYEEEKKCFKTEQKVVCIPPVRFPWEECCPPGRTSKTRTINVLKVHKYKCKACGYKWQLDKLPDPDAAKSESNAAESNAEPQTPETKAPPTTQLEPPASVDPVVAPIDGQQNLLTPIEAPQPGYEPTNAPRPGFEPTEAPRPGFEPVETAVPDFGTVPPAPAN